MLSVVAADKNEGTFFYFFPVFESSHTIPQLFPYTPLKTIPHRFLQGFFSPSLAGHHAPESSRG